MSDKIRDEFKAAADAAGIKDGADRLALWAWWLKAWKAALAQQPDQAVPDCKVYAVIDSMGWDDLDDQEKDDMYRLCRAMLAAATAAPVAQEPAEDASLAFSALPCAGFWRWLHRCNRVPAAAEQPDTVKVQRELIARLDRMYSEGMSINPELEELRAMLSGGEA